MKKKGSPLEQRSSLYISFWMGDISRNFYYHIQQLCEAAWIWEISSNFEHWNLATENNNVILWCWNDDSSNFSYVVYWFHPFWIVPGCLTYARQITSCLGCNIHFKGSHHEPIFLLAIMQLTILKFHFSKMKCSSRRVLGSVTYQKAVMKLNTVCYCNETFSEASIRIHVEKFMYRNLTIDVGDIIKLSKRELQSNK